MTESLHLFSYNTVSCKSPFSIWVSVRNTKTA
jgi:hypothetical protein